MLLSQALSSPAPVATPQRFHLQHPLSRTKPALSCRAPSHTQFAFLRSRCFCQAPAAPSEYPWGESNLFPSATAYRRTLSTASAFGIPAPANPCSTMSAIAAKSSPHHSTSPTTSLPNRGLARRSAFARINQLQLLPSAHHHSSASPQKRPPLENRTVAASTLTNGIGRFVPSPITYTYRRAAF